MSSNLPLATPATRQQYHAEIFRLIQSEQLAAAEKLCSAWLAAPPTSAEAHHLLGIIHAKKHDFLAAIAAYEQAIALSPKATYYNSYGIALKARAQLQEAVAFFQKALSLSPALPSLHANLASTLQHIQSAPLTAQDWLRRGITQQGLGLQQEALESSEQAIRCNGEMFEAWNYRGIALKGLGLFDAAIESFQQALRIAPKNPDILKNCAITLLCAERFADSSAMLTAALRISPDNPTLHFINGTLLKEWERPDAALDAFARALALDPALVEAEWRASLCHLQLGNFANGWKRFEARTRIGEWQDNSNLRSRPCWTGAEDVNGKTIYVYAEQGLGDTIQFAKYASKLSCHGVRVILSIPRVLRGLLANLPGIGEIVCEGDPLPAFDYYCPMMSLPERLALDFPAIDGRPYLQADPESLVKWRARLGKQSTPRIGLCWSGNPAHKKDRQRSLGLAPLSSLLTGNAEYHCLQKDIRENDQQLLDQLPQIRVHSQQLADFSDTAALLSLMDLVITVDTSIAHLAGALGKEVWILLPSNPDWRWLLDRQDSPWYDSARLFRQAQYGDWNSVLDEVREALSDRLAAR